MTRCSCKTRGTTLNAIVFELCPFLKFLSRVMAPNRQALVLHAVLLFMCFKDGFVSCQAQGKTAGGFSLSGMKKALFGNDTQEQRELKIKHLDEQIKQTEQELAQITEETK